MNKKYILFIVTICAGIVITILIYGAIQKSATKEKSLTNACKRNEAEAFIRNHLLGTIAFVDLPEKYTKLNDTEIEFFIQLKEGNQLIDNNQIKQVWQVWENCLRSTAAQNYLGEAYLIIGTSLGEMDGESSVILLQKALEIIRESDSDNPMLEYCCLNNLVRLLVSLVDDDLINQDIDKMAKQYSIEAHHILLNNAPLFHERDASTSIYRLAAESLYWLGNDSLANLYVNQLIKQKYNYEHPELAESYAAVLYGVKNYIDRNYTQAEINFKAAIQVIGTSKSFLDFDLELSYAYLGGVYINQNRPAEAIEFMEKSLKTLQNYYYTDIEEPTQFLSPNILKRGKNTYNVILCYLYLQQFYKEAIKTKVNSFDASNLFQLCSYTNQLISSWFLNAADEETLLKATRLIKKSNANALDILFANPTLFDHVEDLSFQLETEASAFYLNYLMELQKQGNKNKGTYSTIHQLTLELMNAESTSEQLNNKFIQKRLHLLKLKSELWNENHHQQYSLVSNKNTPYDLANNEAVIKYFVSQNNLYGTYYTAKGNGLKILHKADFFDQVKDFDCKIKSGDQPVEYQRLFYKILVEPLESNLQGVTNLTILIDEALNGIIFELLLNKSDELLIQHYAIRYAYSAKNITHQELPDLKNFMAFAPGFETNNAYDKTAINDNVARSISFLDTKNRQMVLAPIKYSIQEVEEIKSLFERKALRTEVYISSQATKTNLINHLSNQNVVHIATHGISKDEYSSGLFFTLDKGDNGFLSLQDLYQLDIQADLVVLSACKTGVGEIKNGEGVMALPRGFICAGTKNIMASLWKVHDEKTKYLMVAFYQHLLHDKVSFAKALQRAKLDCVKNGFLPMDWAGFILYGN